MSRLHTYNRILLAIGGTVTTLFVFTLFATFLVQEVFSGWGDWTQPPVEMVSRPSADSLARHNQRISVVSEAAPELVDTTAGVFLLPVTQERLSSPESIKRTPTGVQLEEVVVTDSRSANYSIRYGRAPGRMVTHGGAGYVNVVLYEASSERSRVLFDERVFIHQFLVLDDETSFALYAAVSSRDTNGDDRISRDDAATIAAYRLDTNERRTYDFEAAFETFRYDAATQTLFVFSRASDDEDRYATERPPRRVYRVDRERQRVRPVTPDSVHARVQAILDRR
mgnify:CR=1 FL=1